MKRFVANAASETFGDKLRELRKPALAKATILVTVLWAFMQLSGFNSILFYMELILIQSKSTIMEPKIVVMYVSASAVVSSVFSIIMIDRFGR